MCDFERTIVFLYNNVNNPVLGPIFTDFVLLKKTSDLPHQHSVVRAKIVIYIDFVITLTKHLLDLIFLDL